MSITALIKQKIEDNLKPVHFEIINESDRHIGHAGHDGSGESHFKLMVVSSAFDGCSRVQRHRQVYDLLDGAFSMGLHALSMQLYTPSEYKNT